MMDSENIPPVKMENIPVADVSNAKKKHQSPCIEKMYQKKTQLEHILLRPDTYIGSVEKEDDKIWVFDDATKRMKFRSISYVPGLYKIFDEILVNAADNKQRDPSMNMLKVDINQEDGQISIWNNGKGVPVVMHKEQKMYVPELIFGHLLTSSNYDDTKKKTVGGRNGYGAKLANIFSTEFIVETVDGKSGFRFKQTFRNNMSKRSKPKKTNSGKSKDFTQITFKPDFEKFGMKRLDKDIISLMKKRVYDVAGVHGKGLKVVLNGEVLNIKTFKDYVNLYVDDASSFVHEKVNKRWEVAIATSKGQFQQCSFVNGICTIKGGKHVNYLTDQISKRLVKEIKKKNKKIALKVHHVKNHLWVFVNVLIDNPAFDSQTKNTLTTNKKNFGSKCELSDKFMKKVCNSDVVGNILAWADYKQSRDLKKSDGGLKKRLTGIPKLEDANNAGSKKLGRNCTLILTEGDSAKNLAVAGFSIVGRDDYGVFPLRGKLLNVREASNVQVLANKEITALKKIIGLQAGKVYEDVNSLRYGSVMIMTDQDHDGSHIKGLLINFFQFFWPSLLKIDGFLKEFITPIVKVSKGKASLSFYTLPEYETWKEENNNGKGWSTKYYKGLGTSTGKEAKEYFTALNRHQIGFDIMDIEDAKCVTLAFGKSHADARKTWMNDYIEGTFLNMDVNTIKYSEFFNKELILFSRANNVRAIPSIVDGLKPGQRKILFSCFKRKLHKELKVAQLVGYVGEQSAYHHGEMSLSGTIIKLAQNFVGSNNINLLYPGGQFGSRDQGGSDHASARYIFTKLSPITRAIFPEPDDNVLNFLDDDGLIVEPEWYVPVIPTVLLNGVQGIGTGWSTSIPSYNPRDLIKSMRQLIDTGGVHVDSIQPWVRGWVGTIAPKDATRMSYTNEGLIEKVDETTLLISELPFRKWTADYKRKVLDKLLEANKILDYRNHCTTENIVFHVTMEPNALLQAEAQGFHAFFKLSGPCNLTNMMMFNPVGLTGSGNIKKYDNVEDIMRRFFEIRLHFYHERKKFLTNRLIRELRILENRVRFILAVIAAKNGVHVEVEGEEKQETLEVRNRPKAEILNELLTEGYDQFPPEKKGAVNIAEAEDDEEDDGSDIAKLTTGYNYLLSMNIWSLSYEKVEKLKNQKETKTEELDVLCRTSPEQLWEYDLDTLLVRLDEFEEELAASIKAGAVLKNKHQKKKKAKAKSVKKEKEDEYVPGGGKKRKSKAKAKPRKPKEKKIKAKKATKVKTVDIKEASEMIQDINISGSRKGLNKTQKNIQDSDEELDEVPELPEDSDVELELGHISDLALEMRNSIASSAPPMKEEGGHVLTPKKPGRKRKKQLTPMIKVVHDVPQKKGGRKQKKTKGIEN